MGGKDKECKIIAGKENIWLGNVTPSLNPVQALGAPGHAHENLWLLVCFSGKWGGV